MHESGLGCGRPVRLATDWPAAHVVRMLYAGRAVTQFFR